MQRTRKLRSKKGSFSLDAGFALFLALSIIFAGISLISEQSSRISRSFENERMEIQALEASDRLIRSDLAQENPALNAIYPHSIDPTKFTNSKATSLKEKLRLNELKACLLNSDGSQMFPIEKCIGSGGSTCIRRIANYQTVYQNQVVLLETCVS